MTDLTYERFMSLFKKDDRATAQWRKEAKECYDFVALRQWDEEDANILKARSQPVITFDRVGVVIDSVSGNEMQNRNQVTFYPREQGDATASEVYTEAARWFDNESDAEDEDSEAFRDTIICGMGWTDSVIDYEGDDEEPMPVTERMDPLEMRWSVDSVRANLKGARRLWRVKRIPLAEAKEKFPGVDPSKLDAGKKLLEKNGGPNNNDPLNRYQNDSEDADEDEDDTRLEEGMAEKLVTIIHGQFWMYEDYYKVADPLTNSVAEFSVEDFQQLQTKLKKLGVPLNYVKTRRKRYKQVFLGKEILGEVIDAPCPYAPSWNCITGKLDNNTKTFYGLVKAMMDPQRWANKWLAQVLHILNSNSKGGLIVEEGALRAGTNIEDLERDWASPDAITVVGDGAITMGQIKEKPPAQFPSGYQVLTEFAIKAIREVTGVSLEMLGLREMNQPGVLESQRKQAGMTVLQWLFNSLRKYRKMRGRLMLHYIDEELADGRLVRIVGEGKAQYVPLMKQTKAKWDIIVDESAASVNQREKVWDSLTQILPGIKDMVPPDVMLQLLEYSPVPASVVQGIRKVIEAKAPEEKKRAEEQAKALALEFAAKQAEVDKTRAEITETEADTAMKRARAEDIRAKTGPDVTSKYVDSSVRLGESLKPDRSSAR